MRKSATSATGETSATSATRATSATGREDRDGRDGATIASGTAFVPARTASHAVRRASAARTAAGGA
ncbi:hypothetical protein [Sorangium sp. So ce341]|uniref:hypothetical protein n=1 Tax=Sorangium sp. So ce341 TaxID=3133302 RepID=UPI003F607D7F